MSDLADLGATLRDTVDLAARDLTLFVLLLDVLTFLFIYFIPTPSTLHPRATD